MPPHTSDEGGAINLGPNVLKIWEISPSTTLGDLLEMSVLEFHPRSTEAEAPEDKGSSHPVLSSPPGRLKFDNHWPFLFF